MSRNGAGGNPFDIEFEAVDEFIFSQISVPAGPDPEAPADGWALRELLRPDNSGGLGDDGSDATFVDYPAFDIGKPGGDGGGGGGGGGRPGGGGGGGGGGSGGSTTVEHRYTSGVYDAGFNPDLRADNDRGTTDPFNFEIAYVGDGTTWDTTADTITATIMSYVEAATEFLSAVLAYGYPDDDNGLTSDGTAIALDDLYIEVNLETGTLSGTVASAEIYAANDWDGNGTAETPAGATLTIDLADAGTLDGLGVLDDAILHELIHALGFGVLWDVAGNDLTQKSQGQLVYTGNASTYYDDGFIPVEGGGPRGTSGGHWDETALDKELMTGIVELTDDMYLAAFSLASLEDLGIYTLASGWEDELGNLNGSSEDGGIDLLTWYALYTAEPDTLMG